MALSSLRLRQALKTLTPLLGRRTAITQVRTPLAVETSGVAPLLPPTHLRFRTFRSSPIWFSSSRSFNNQNEEIGPDTILFEGCDYNHWLITMDFPKDPKPTPEQMVETYVQTLAKGLNISIEEAKKKMYACSTTTYNGFQAVMTEEESEKFRGLPGVVFILPDSYINPATKEYGGDKYDNGIITPRPPPVQFGRTGGRYGDRNRNTERPRYDRQGGPMPNQQGNPQYDNRGPAMTNQQGNPLFDNRGPAMTNQQGNPRFDNRGPAMPNQQGNPQFDNRGPTMPNQQGNPQFDNRGPAMPNQQGNPQFDNRGPGMPNQQGNPHFDNRGPGMPNQQGNPQFDNRGPVMPNQQGNPQYDNRGWNHGAAQNYPPQQNYGPPGQAPTPMDNRGYVPGGRNNYQGERRDPVPSYPGSYNQGQQGDNRTHGQGMGSGPSGFGQHQGHGESQRFSQVDQRDNTHGEASNYPPMGNANRGTY